MFGEASVKQVIWRNMVLMFFKNRWGRGQPDDIGAINLGDEKFDPDSDKKRTGQILWIRGLTRLQTQVTIPISHTLYNHNLIFNQLSISSSIFCYYILIHLIYSKKITKNRHFRALNCAIICRISFYFCS